MLKPAQCAHPVFHIRLELCLNVLRHINNLHGIANLRILLGKLADSLIVIAQIIGAKVELVDATARALEAGSSRAVNAVMLGAFAKHTSFSRDSWIQGITDASPAKFVQSNIDAFDNGYGK